MIQTNVDLSLLNSFGVSALATSFAAIHEAADITTVLERAEQPPALILGGGSNILLLGDIHGLVLQNKINQLRIIEESDTSVIVQVGGGMNWHDFVLWTLSQGYGGIENLALIPGTVGAAPMQNIGAYGVELQDVFVRLSAFDLHHGKERIFEHADCLFGYRTSIFKTEPNKGKFFLTSVAVRLTKRNHRLRTDYGAIQSVLQQQKVTNSSPADIAAAVIEIRRSKLPDWQQLGNAGSFFKNPVIPTTEAEQLLEQFPDMPHYPTGEDLTKLPAAWLIDQCGWKGKRDGAVGCYHRQALVIVNHGGASGKEILSFSQGIQDSVEERFGIRLEREVNAIGSINE